MNSIHDYESDIRAVPFDGTDMPTEDGSMQIPLTDKTITTEINGDFSLPDYQPEIKRLLKIRAALHPPTCYAGSGEVDVNGGVDYFVFYTGNDNGLYCAPLHTDYHLTAATNDDVGMESITPALCLCQSVVESAVGRVTAPRRLNIRCRLQSRIQALGERTSSDISSDHLSPDSTEVLTAHAPICRLYETDCDPIMLQDDVIPDVRAGEVRVVCSEGQVMVTEATAGMGALNCRGEVTMKLTLCPVEADADGLTLPMVLTRKIPFFKTVEMDGVTPHCAGCAHGICSDISAELEDGRIHVEASVLLHAMAHKNEMVSYVKDLYSTRRIGQCRYIDYPVSHAIRCVCSNFTQSESLSLSEVGIAPSARIIDISGAAFPEDLAVYPDQNKCVLHGKCRYQILLLRDGEYMTSDLELPFRYEMEAEAADGTLFSGHVTVITCRTRMDGERMGVDAELAVSGRLYQPQTLTLVSDVTYGEEFARRHGEYVICFPAPDDSLWSVAKRYHAPMAALSAANSLSPTAAIDSPASIAGNHYLIV